MLEFHAKKIIGSCQRIAKKLHGKWVPDDLACILASCHFCDVRTTFQWSTEKIASFDVITFEKS